MKIHIIGLILSAILQSLAVGFLLDDDERKVMMMIDDIR